MIDTSMGLPPLDGFMMGSRTGTLDLSLIHISDKIGKDLGGKSEIVSFVRYEKGEGLEKKSDNFADEVASMIK